MRQSFAFSRRSALLMTLAVMGVGMGVGCEKKREPKAFAERLAFSVEATSVTRWEDYVTELQPNFVLTEIDAYGKAIPTTSRVQDSALKAIRTRVGIDLAPASALPGGFGKKDETFSGKEVPSGFTDDVSKPTGDGPNVFSADTKVDTNPYLNYLAASALFQEVKLINRYLKDANLEKDYQPYIVQFLVNQDVRGQDKAFDSEIILSFFGSPLEQSNEGGGYETQTVEAIKRIPNLPPSMAANLATAHTMSAASGILSTPTELTDPQKDAVKQARNLISRDKLPMVKPLLVTDQVESSLRASRAEELQQFGLAIAAGYAGIGGKVDLEDVSRKIRSALRADLNERFSVNRLNENTVRIHLGAREAPGEKKGMVYTAEEGNHRASLLVLVPKTWVQEGESKVFFGARMRVLDAATGDPYDTVDNRKVNQVLGTIAPNAAARAAGYGGNFIFDAKHLSDADLLPATWSQVDFETKLDGPEKIAACLKKWEGYVRSGKYAEFREEVYEKFKPVIGDQAEKRDRLLPLINSLWHQMSELSIGSRYVTGHFSAPKGLVPSLGNSEVAKTWAIDDGKFTSVILPGVMDISPDRVTGELQIKLDGGGELKLSSVGVTMEGKNQMRAQFSSLVDLKLKPEAETSANVMLHYPGIDVVKKVEARYLATGESTISGITVKTNVDKLPANTRADVELDIQVTPNSPASLKKGDVPDAKKLGQYYVLSVKGASITAPTPDGILWRDDSMASWKYIIQKKGLVKLTLSPVAPESEVTFTITPPAGYAKPDPIVLKTGK